MLGLLVMLKRHRKKSVTLVRTPPTGEREGGDNGPINPREVVFVKVNVTAYWAGIFFKFSEYLYHRYRKSRY